MKTLLLIFLLNCHEHLQKIIAANLVISFQLYLSTLFFLPKTLSEFSPGLSHPRCLFHQPLLCLSFM